MKNRNLLYLLVLLFLVPTNLALATSNAGAGLIGCYLRHAEPFDGQAPEVDELWTEYLKQVSNIEGIPPELRQRVTRVGEPGVISFSQDQLTGVWLLQVKRSGTRTRRSVRETFLLLPAEFDSLSSLSISSDSAIEKANRFLDEEFDGYRNELTRLDDDDLEAASVLFANDHLLLGIRTLIGGTRSTEPFLFSPRDTIQVIRIGEASGRLDLNLLREAAELKVFELGTMRAEPEPISRPERESVGDLQAEYQSLVIEANAADPQFALLPPEFSEFSKSRRGTGIIGIKRDILLDAWLVQARGLGYGVDQGGVYTTGANPIEHALLILPQNSERLSVVVSGTDEAKSRFAKFKELDSSIRVSEPRGGAIVLFVDGQPLGQHSESGRRKTLVPFSFGSNQHLSIIRNKSFTRDEQHLEVIVNLASLQRIDFLDKSVRYVVADARPLLGENGVVDLPEQNLLVVLHGNGSHELELDRTQAFQTANLCIAEVLQVDRTKADGPGRYVGSAVVTGGMTPRGFLVHNVMSSITPTPKNMQFSNETEGDPKWFQNLGDLSILMDGEVVTQIALGRQAQHVSSTLANRIEQDRISADPRAAIPMQTLLWLRRGVNLNGLLADYFADLQTRQPGSYSLGFFADPIVNQFLESSSQQVKNRAAQLRDQLDRGGR